MNSRATIAKPASIKKPEVEEAIFDADRDNGGKGVSPDEIIKILRAVSPLISQSQLPKPPDK